MANPRDGIVLMVLLKLLSRQKRWRRFPNACRAPPLLVRNGRASRRRLAPTPTPPHHLSTRPSGVIDASRGCCPNKASLAPIRGTYRRNFVYLEIKRLRKGART